MQDSISIQTHMRFSDVLCIPNATLTPEPVALGTHRAKEGTLDSGQGEMKKPGVPGMRKDKGRPRGMPGEGRAELWGRRCPGSRSSSPAVGETQHCARETRCCAGETQVRIQARQSLVSKASKALSTTSQPRTFTGNHTDIQRGSTSIDRTSLNCHLTERVGMTR